MNIARDEHKSPGQNRSNSIRVRRIHRARGARCYNRRSLIGQHSDMTKSTQSRQDDTRKGLGVEVLVFIGAVAVSAEFVVDLLFPGSPITLSWLLLPMCIALSLPTHFASYFSKRRFGRIILLVGPLILYALANYGPSNVLPAMEVSRQVRMAIASVAVYWFFSSVTSTEPTRRALTTGLILGGIAAASFRVAALWGVGESAFRYGRVGSQAIVRLDAFGDPNITTAYLMTVLSAIPLAAVSSRPFSAPLTGVVAAITIMTIVATGSRGGILAAIACVILMAYTWIKYDRHSAGYLLRAGLTMIAFLMILLSVAAFSELIDTFVLRWEYGYSGEDYSVEVRLESWKWLARDVFTKFRLIGPGYQRFAYELGPFLRPAWPHASIVDAYIVGGIPLMATWLALWAEGAKQAFSKLSSNCAFDRATGIFFISLIGSLFILFSGLSHIWMKLIWAVLGASSNLAESTRPVTRFQLKRSDSVLESSTPIQVLSTGSTHR